MAVLDALPNGKDIQSFRGVLDFYVWKGIPVVRTWPRKYLGEHTAAQLPWLAQWYAYLRAVSYTDPMLQNAYATRVPLTAWTWRDLTVAAAYGKLYL